MGGKIFAHLKPPLSTPRMPPALYTSLRSQYLSLLSALYTQVGTPIEAPEKPSYGDIDILVADPISPPPSTSLSTALGAKASLTAPASPATSYAVPHPELPNAYVQLDVHVCEPSTFAWELFHHSHGDLWNILGSTIRIFGLTANNVGLQLRIPEIDTLDRRQSLLHLTSDADAVLDFLRLDRRGRWRAFASVEELFAYAASTRFFRKEAYVRDTLKANDRKRMAQRELYRRFVEEWVPTFKGDGGEGAEGLTRKGVLEEALGVFGKRGEYEERLRKWRAERGGLSIKQQANGARRANAVADVEYADAWIRELGRAGS